MKWACPLVRLAAGPLSERCLAACNSLRHRHYKKNRSSLSSGVSRNVYGLARARARGPSPSWRYSIAAFELSHLGLCRCSARSSIAHGVILDKGDGAAASVSHGLKEDGERARAVDKSK